MTEVVHVTEAAQPAPRLSVCLVEDQVPLREWLVTLLSDQEIVVVAAVSTVAEGDAAIRRHVPHVAIIDNHLPDGRGIDLCDSLSRELPGVITILHTGLVSVEEEREALNVGVAAVVLKTIRCRELVDLLATLRSEDHPGPSA